MHAFQAAIYLFRQGPPVRRAARRDGNEAELVKMARTLGAHWIYGGPLDGLCWSPKRPGWHIVEIKLPGREGSKNEYTEKQKKFFWDCGANGSRWWTWRTFDDVLMCLQEKEIWRPSLTPPTSTSQTPKSSRKE